MAFDWNDLRYFLAVARLGSTTAAALAMDVSGSTVSRRITALEQALGAKLFERRPDGYRLTELGQGLVADAEATEAAAGQILNRVSAFGRGVSGCVRVTAMTEVAATLILPHLGAFSTQHPAVEVELHTSDQKSDLLRGEADVAVRIGPRPNEPGLVIRRVGEVGVHLYCSKAYAERRGVPTTAQELNEHHLIRGVGRVDTRPGHLWMAEHAPDARVAHRASTTDGVLAAVQQGLGIGSLPTFVMANVTGLVRLEGVGPGVQIGTWLIATEEARALAHVRSFLDFLAPLLAQTLARTTEA